MNELKQIVLSPDPRLSEECAPVEKIDDEVRKLLGNTTGLSHYVVAMRGGNPYVWAWNQDDPHADAEFKMLTDQLTLDGQEWKGR